MARLDYVSTSIKPDWGILFFVKCLSQRRAALTNCLYIASLSPFSFIDSSNSQNDMPEYISPKSGEWSPVRYRPE
jgi:hypothetical protein